MRARATRAAAIRVAVAVAATSLVGCAEQENLLDAVFDSPSGLAIAGTVQKYLFIANVGEDTLHVMELGESLGDLRFVSSPARYFSVRVPAGPHPTDLVGTPAADSDALAGRFVAVLNSPTDSIGLIDADSRAQVLEDGEPHRLVLGSGLRPVAMIGSPVPCAAPCAGLLYVALAGVGKVAEVEIQEVDDGNGGLVGRLKWPRSFNVGGQPHELAINDSGTVLFATDAESQEVIRVDLRSGAVDRAPLGAIGGPLAVSRDETLLLVGRPEFLDVLIFKGASSGAMTPFYSDPVWAPAPRCLQSCDSSTPCRGDLVHAADRAICSNAAGLDNTLGQPYRAIYLGTAPVLITTMGIRGADDSQKLEGPECRRIGDNTADHRQYNQFAAVATLDGRIVFITLRDADDKLAPEVLNELWCQEPQLQSTNEEAVDPAILFAACPAVPREDIDGDGTGDRDRRRFSCVDDHVVVLPGATGRQEIQLEWEGVLLDRTSGGGEILQNGRFVDRGVELDLLDLREGDIVEILSSASCPEIPSGTHPCNLERRIIGIIDDPELIGDAGRELQLEGELQPSCFVPGGITYKIRAGDQFLVRVGDSPVERLGPGDRLGPGGNVGRQQRLMFGILDTLDPLRDEPACVRNGDEATPGLLQFPLERDLEIPISFDISDAFVPIVSGIRADADGNETSLIGRLPTAMVLSTTGANGPVAFISYGGTGFDRVLAFSPFEIDSMFAVGRYLEIRSQPQRNARRQKEAIPAQMGSGLP